MGEHPNENVFMASIIKMWLLPKFHQMPVGTSGDQSIKITCSKKSHKLMRSFYWMSVILD